MTSLGSLGGWTCLLVNEPSKADAEAAGTLDNPHRSAQPATVRVWRATCFFLGGEAVAVRKTFLLVPLFLGSLLVVTFCAGNMQPPAGACGPTAKPHGLSRICKS